LKLTLAGRESLCLHGNAGPSHRRRVLRTTHLDT
jgi:hypothetical protein